jgi:hypothetical protein
MSNPIHRLSDNQSFPDIAPICRLPSPSQGIGFTPTPDIKGPTVCERFSSSDIAFNERIAKALAKGVNIQMAKDLIELTRR